MCRVSSETRGIREYATQPRSLDVPPRSSKWTPALRRIEWSPFHRSERREDFETSNPSAVRDDPLLDNHHLVTANTQHDIHSDGSKGNTIQKRPMGPREPKDPSKFNFFRRSVSKSNRVVQEHQDQLMTLRDQAQAQPKVYMANNQIPATYKLWHAPSDSQDSSGVPKSIGYVPTHAALDFPKVQLPSDPEPEIYQQSNNEAYQQLTADASQPRVQDANDEADDYQTFLLKSQFVASRNEEARLMANVATRTPRASEVMEEIMQNRRSQALEAMSRHSAAPRPRSMAGSFMGAVADYIKPTRTGSIRTQQTSYTIRDDQISMKDSTYTHELPGIGGSRISRSALSTDRDEKGIEIASKRFSWAGNNQGRKGKPKEMPVSPGLDRFNRGVRQGVY